MNQPLIKNGGPSRSQGSPGSDPPTSSITHCKALEHIDGVKLIQAAWHIEDGLMGHFSEEIPRGHDIPSFRARRLRASSLAGYYDASAMILAFLCFLETPLWCNTSEQTTHFISPEERCPFLRSDLPDASLCPPGSKVRCPAPELSGLPQIPPLYGMALEAMLLAVCTVVLLQHKNFFHALERKGYTAPRRRGLQTEFLIPMAGLIWIDLLIYSVFRQRNFRFAPYGRLVLLLYWPRVKTAFHCAKDCLSEFSNIMLSLVVSVVFFAWLFSMIVDDMRDENSSEVLWPDNKEFHSFGSSLRTFFSIMTGAGYPDYVTKALWHYRWTNAIFVPFMVLCFFLLTQLILAVVYDVYQGRLEEELMDVYSARIKSVAAAFTLLHTTDAADESVITIGSFSKLLDLLRSEPSLAKSLEPGNARAIFAALDDDDSGTLSMQEFFDAIDLLTLKFRSYPTTSLLQRTFGMKLKRITWFVDSGWLEGITSVVLTLNAGFIVLESIYDLNSWHEPSWIGICEIVFSMIYVIEILLKLSVCSFRSYWFSGGNKFDFSVGWLLFIFGMTILNPAWKLWLPRSALRYLNIMRILRMWKLLFKLRRWRRLVQCIGALFSISFEMVMLLTMSMTAYAQFGMQLLGGKLYLGNPKLKDLDYINNGYHVLNFNDSMNSFLSLFTCGSVMSN